jgi:anti-sigma factor RsiW
MNVMHLTDDDLVLHYYGEMSDAAEEKACAHLESCEACRENLAGLQRVMAAIDSAPLPEPDAWFEQRTWARLEPSLAEHSRAASPVRTAWALPWRAMAWGAAAALVIIAAFVAGQFTSSPSVPTQQVVNTPATQPMQERVLVVDLGDHLDRSEAALVEFVSGTDGRALAGGRERVEELVAANRLYRQTAVVAGDQGVADVLDDLERVLIEIAGSAPTASTSDLDIVRQRIDTRGLLFKVRVMRERLQERAKDTTPAKGQETTI